MTVKAAATALVAVLAPTVLAQPQPGPPECSTEPACVEAMSCAPRREPFYWRNIFDINRCGLSMEVRVGLSVSMTGPLSRNATTQQILTTLRNLSSAKGQVDFVSIGVSFPYCLIFCVMDDESLPWKAVEHYRLFAGASGYDSSMDVMLGPSSSNFRLAASQVADEFQRPLVSWSLPEIMGVSFVRPAQSTVASTGAWLGNLLTSSSVIETDNVFGRLPEEMLFTCRDLVVPSNYSLRTMAQFLPCDGPCELSRDLDYCALPRQQLSISGHWDPPSVLRSGGWDNGCLNFDSNGTAAWLDVVLTFDTPRASVNVGFWGASPKTGPLLVLGSRLYSSSPPGPLVLPSGIQVLLDSSSDERIEFSICLKQDCQHFTCPAGYKRAAFGNLCNGVQCAPEDLQNCCTLDQLPDVNGPFWSNSFSSVLDLAVPPRHWLNNTLPRLLHPQSQFLLCVAQADPDNVFSDLCASHVNTAIEVGFRTQEKPMPVINADPGVHNALINLMLIRPKPSVILICSDLETYSRFIHGLTALHITFEWVVSCIPFGAELQTKVQGSRLAWNFLEPTPWPSSLRMLKNDEELMDKHSILPTESFAQLTSREPLLTMQTLALHSAVQIVNQVVHGAFILGIQEQSSDAAVALMDAGPLGQQVLQNFKGTELLIEMLNWGSFMTYMGTMTFDQNGRRQIQSRHEVGMRQYWPLEDVMNMSDALSVPVVYTWIYLQARHIFSMYREFDGNQVLAPYYLPVLADKSSMTYPCPPGCIERQLQCFSCPPGTFRQASGSACSPCPPNTSLFQDHWASDRCFTCPTGGICTSTVDPPVASAGYIRIPDFAYQETFADLIGPNACSFEAGGGLSNLRATDLSRWDEAKSRSSWTIVPCMPPEACLGSNRCAEWHRGATCSGCKPGSSKFQWYFFGLDCEECPPLALQVLPISLMVIIQVAATILLSVSNQDSACNEHSLAGPIMFSFFRTLQTHAVLSKLMIEPFPKHAFNELGPLLWICTISQVVFAPCLLPLTSCLLPLHTEGDLMVYHLLELASRFAALLLSCLVMLCLARQSRLDAFIRTGYNGLHFVLPSLSFYALQLSKCELGYQDTLVLAANADIPCPALTSNLAYLFAALHIVAMISQWLCLPWILTNSIYRHVQDCYGMGIHKLLYGRRYWKILDDICIAVSTLFATVLGEAGMTYCMFATEGSYAILTRVSQAYSFLSGNLMVHFKSLMALNILCLCSANLFTDFLIDFFSAFLAQDLDHASMICRATILTLSLAHMLLATTMALIENRVALVVNTRLLSAPSDGWTVRLSRMVKGFGSFHSMQVHRYGSNSQLVFDARSVPQKHRKILLHGVTSTVNYILYKSTTLRLTEVRDMVNQAVEQILVARKSQVMSRLNMRGSRRKGELTQEDDQAIEALLQSDLIAPHELVSTVEDMCSGDFLYRQGTKKSSAVAEDSEGEDEDEEPKTPTEKIPHRIKKAVATATKKTSKPKHLRRRFHEAQAECARSTAKLLTEAESINRRLGQIWMISTENSKLIPAYLGKAETLHGRLQRIQDFLGEERDVRHPAVENFLDEMISQTRDWNSQVENLTRQRRKDKDPQGDAAFEAELDQELRNLFQEEAESSVTMEPDDDKSSSTGQFSLRPERPRVKLPFNRIDFQSRTQPAPSRFPDLDWHR